MLDCSRTQALRLRTVQDLHSEQHCIEAFMAASHAGADEGLKLDCDGFVAASTSGDFFIVVKCVSTAT